MPICNEKKVDVLDAICDFAQVLKDVTKQEMIEHNTDYIEKVTSLNEKKERYRVIMEQCPMERRQVIQGYIVAMMDKHSDEGDHFYLRGYRDCIALLHRLNLFK